MTATTSIAETGVAILLLGQSGCRVDAGGVRLYLDPYLSNSVAELDGADLERLVPIAFPPDRVNDADWVLITHAHIDHCDPQTLPALAAASPGARLVGPLPVVQRLRDWGIDPGRIILATEQWTDLAPKVRLHAVPAAHPVIARDDGGHLECVGYVLEVQQRRIYFAGDTSLTAELLQALHGLSPIAVALLPVNEPNYFRARRGIIGNMSVREAFGLAAEIGVQRVVPVHWDMFAANGVQRDEIAAVYREFQTEFELLLGSSELRL